MATPPPPHFQPGKDGDDGSGQARTFDEGNVVHWNCWNPNWEMFALCISLIYLCIYIYIFSSSSLWYQKSMIWIFWIHSSLNWATNQFDMSGRPLSTSSRHGWLPAASVAICRTGTRLIWWDPEVIATLKSQPGTQRHPAPLNQASVFQHFPTLPFHENRMILSWLSHVIPTPHKLSWHHGKKNTKVR